MQTKGWGKQSKGYLIVDENWGREGREIITKGISLKENFREGEKAI